MYDPSERPPSMLCPLCERRLPDTKVAYNEVISSNTTVSDGASLMQNPNVIVQRGYNLDNVASEYTNSSVDADGDVMVCAPCAARYERSIALRASSRPMMMWGIVALVVGVVVFVATLSPTGSRWELLAVAPLLVGAVLLASGLGATVVGKSLARPMIRYLLGKRANGPA